jgi:cysteine desulfurase/selenocysteine lyase
MTYETIEQTFDVPAVRADFPILSRMFGDHRLVYLDSAATSQKPAPVIEALAGYYRRSNANVHRGVYRLAEEATEAYEDARRTVARFINADPEETIFTRNASEAINLVAYAWGRAQIGRQDAIALTPLEHHSNLVPWQMLSAETGAQLRFVDLAADGSLDLTSLQRILEDGRVKLISCAFISNVLGTIAPVEAIVTMAHQAGALVLFDAAQAAPHRRIDVKVLDVDFLAFTGHKMLGPMGIGVLYGRRQILEEMPPFLGGGEMIRHVDSERATWNDLPWKFEAGTPSVGDAVALASAIDYLETIGMDAIESHDRTLTTYAVNRLRTIPGLRIHGPRERGALVAFTVDGIHPHDLASLLDEEAIAVRAGHHCAQPLHAHLGLPATTRASFYLYNDLDDVDRLITGIERAQQIFAL